MEQVTNPAILRHEREMCELAMPFPHSEIQWLPGVTGFTGGNVEKPWAKLMAYFDARQIFARLTRVVGADRWQIDYKEICGSFCAGIGILLPHVELDPETGEYVGVSADMEWVWKWDGAPANDVQGGDNEMSIKGGKRDRGNEGYARRRRRHGPGRGDLGRELQLLGRRKQLAANREKGWHLDGSARD